MRTLLRRVLGRLAAAALAEQREEWRRDFRKLRELHVETRLRLRVIEDALRPKAPARSSLTHRVPLVVDAPPAPAARAARPAPAQTPVSGEIERLTACPVCGSADGTVVCEFNKFLLLESAPDADAKVYDYTLCHACGVTYAARRPVGRRYADLLERFEASLGRVPAGQVMTGRLAMNSARLVPDTEAALRRSAARGVFVSEHEEAGADFLPALLRDRLANAQHVELLTSLLPLRRPRVLEIRPRFGAIGAALRRLCDAEVFGLPLFEGQQLLNREVYGGEVSQLLDYDRFRIPYDGSFDLVVANHMVTHALRPAEFLALVHERLAPGGHLYLYNEPDDAEFLDHRDSMIKVLNPFHFQAFDGPSLRRALARHGFRTVFATHERGNAVVLAERSEADGLFQPMTGDERETRLARYRAARDMAILRLPPKLRGAFADQWEGALERTVLAGLAELTPDGGVRILRQADPRPDEGV